jgi:death on curing protein
MFDFITLEDVFDLHGDSLRDHGGMPGVRDLGLVESALGSAQNAFYYGGGDVFDVAAAYAFHLAESQAFLDGNKRTAISTALMFLNINGHVLIPEQVDQNLLYDAMIAIAHHELDKRGLADLLRRLFYP